MFITWIAGLVWGLFCASAEPVLPDGEFQDVSIPDSVIPNKILFNYKENLLIPSAKANYSEFQRNLHKTIKLHPGMQVVFYDNNECARAIKRVHSKALREFFVKEETGMFKSDICRLAMLWEHGGYYFDNDMDLLKDVRRSLPSGVSFSSVLALSRCNRPNAVFQAFVASMPRHPVIMDAMDGTLEWYKKKVYLDTNGVPKGFKRLMGTEVLGSAVMKWLGVDHIKGGRSQRQNATEHGAGLLQTARNAVYFFEEAEGHLNDYGLKHRDGRGSSCNVYVRDSRGLLLCHFST